LNPEPPDLNTVAQLNVRSLLSPIPPFWIIAFWGFLALVVILFSLPEITTAWMVVIFFFLLVTLNPLNGISFLLLAIPFFLGNPFKPYIFLLEIFIYGTGLAALFHGLLRRKAGAFPLLGPLLLVLLAAGLSLPLNGKELYYTLWALPLRDLFFQWLSGNPGYPVHFLRVLFNLWSAAGLFYVVVHWLKEDSVETFLIRNLQAMVGLAALIVLAGLLFLFRWIPPGRSYLSLSLVGTHEQAITAFAFNRQYLAQYLLLCLPLAYFSFQRSQREGDLPRLFLSLGTITLILFALAASIQRSAYLVFIFQIGVWLILYGAFFKVAPSKFLFFLLFPILAAAGLVISDWVFLDQRFMRRLTYLSQIGDIRTPLWSAAWSMFVYSPFLGVGLGSFYNFFPDFYPGSPGQWQSFNAVRGNAHSMAIQLIAEQGIIGLFAFLSLIGAISVIAFRTLQREQDTEKKWLVLSISAALTTWLILGIFHHIVYDLRALEIYFWIFSAFLLVLAGKRPFAFLPGKKLAIGIIIGLTAALAYQGKLIAAYPIGDRFQVGFYHWEKQADGSRNRWMGRRAVIHLPTEPGKLIVELSAPLPGLDKNPQAVRITWGKEVYHLILRDRDWKRLALPVNDTALSHQLLILETRHTFNPARSFGSRDNRNLGLQLRDFRWERG